jgi:hypothetical protein
MSETTHKTVFSDREKFEVQGQDYQINYRVKYNIPDDTYECSTYLLRVREVSHGTHTSDHKNQVHEYEQFTSDKEKIETHLSEGIRRCEQQAHRIESRLDVEVQMNDVNEVSRIDDHNPDIDDRLKDAKWVYEQYILYEKTQSEIADICDCSQAAVHRWLTEEHEIETRSPTSKIE